LIAYRIGIILRQALCKLLSGTFSDLSNEQTGNRCMHAMRSITFTSDKRNHIAVTFYHSRVSIVYTYTALMQDRMYRGRYIMNQHDREILVSVTPDDIQQTK